jgi:uncharacterized metal-binding protein YceD (DUF177 family)
MKASDLQLNAHEIPAAGVSLVGELPPEWVAESLLPAYRANAPIELKLEVKPVGDNYLARGRFKVRLDFDCSRTLEPSSIDLEGEVGELFTPGDKHSLKLADEDVSSDDLGADEPWIIDDRGHIDLEALVREHLVLAQDPYPVAPDAPAQRDPDDPPLWSSQRPGAPVSTGRDALSEPTPAPVPEPVIDARWERLKNLKLD